MQAKKARIVIPDGLYTHPGTTLAKKAKELSSTIALAISLASLLPSGMFRPAPTQARPELGA
jgi:hypothetical protein